MKNSACGKRSYAWRRRPCGDCEAHKDSRRGVKSGVGSACPGCGPEDCTREKRRRVLGAITSSNVANAIVKLVAADALPVLVGNLVMGNLVNRDYEPVLAQAGDTVNVPIPPTMVANNIAEGGTVQTQNPSLGNAQIVLNTHAEATFQIPDVTKVLAVPDLLRIYMEPAVAAIAQKIESDLLSLYAGFTANDPVGTAGTPPPPTPTQPGGTPPGLFPR